MSDCDVPNEVFRVLQQLSSVEPEEHRKQQIAQNVKLLKLLYPVFGLEPSSTCTSERTSMMSGSLISESFILSPSSKSRSLAVGHDICVL
jgi:hypothetical protein